MNTDSVIEDTDPNQPDALTPPSMEAMQVMNFPLANSFKQFFDKIADSVHANAKDKGFWDANTEDGTKIALMHSELSEALEAIRKPVMKGHLNSHSLLEEELADVIIRIMDFAAAEGLDIAGAIIAKARFNMNRDHMHGGKAF